MEHLHVAVRPLEHKAPLGTVDFPVEILARVGDAALVGDGRDAAAAL